MTECKPPVREGGRGAPRARDEGKRGGLRGVGGAPSRPRAQRVKSRVLAACGRVPHAPKHRVLISDTRRPIIGTATRGEGGASLGSKGEGGAVGDNHEQAPRMAVY